MLKKALAAAALLAVAGAPISAYAASALLGRTAAPATGASQANGKRAALYVLLVGAAAGTIILITGDSDGDDDESP